MKVKYIGRSFGFDGLTDGKIYEVVGIDAFTGALRIIDDSGEDYLYSPTRPKPLMAKEAYGRFEIVEDDAEGSIAALMAADA